MVVLEYDFNSIRYKDLRQMAGTAEIEDGANLEKVLKTGEGLKLTPIDPHYLVWLNCGSVDGSFTIRKDGLAIMLYNDYPISEIPEDMRENYVQASRSDLAEMIKIVETPKKIGGGPLAGFLREKFGLQGDLYKKVLFGVEISNKFPLDYAAPDHDFEELLREAGNRYSWREEELPGLVNKINVARFIPKS